MSYIIYPLQKARDAYYSSVTANYDAQRNAIYKKMREKNINASSFLNEENFKKVEKKGSFLFKDLIKDLESVPPKITNRNFVFNGNNDNATIEKLINIAKSLQNVKDFDEMSQIIETLENANSYIKEEMRNKVDKGMFSLATNDFNKLKEAILLAKEESTINSAKEKAKIYFSGLIGNLGESLGVLYGYSLLTKEMQTKLKEKGIEVKVTNVGTQVVDGKKVVGDTKVEFVYKDGNILGSISMSNKLAAKYGKTKSHNFKLRTTTINQLKETLKPSYYNLISYHIDRRTKVDLCTYTSKTLSFRRYVASLILEENLFGAFEGDNVYFFNYGTYIFTMNDLLDYWIGGKGTPIVANISRRTRDNILLKDNMTIEKAEKGIGSLELKVMSSLHMGNLLNALDNSETDE